MIKRKVTIILFLTVLSLNLTAQSSNRNILVDSITKEPIPFAHLTFFSNAKRQFNITNEDGRFNLITAYFDSLEISHVGYEKLVIQKTKIGSDTIRAIPRAFQLSEVTIQFDGARGIIEKVIDKLEENHSDVPNILDAFVRVVEYPKDSSKIHLFEEHLFSIYFKNLPKFKIIKSRAKPYSKEGDAYFPDRRFIDATYIGFHNLICMVPDFLKQRKLKKYDFVFDDEIEMHGETYYKIIVLDAKNNGTTVAIMHIDVESYGIQSIQHFFDPANSDTYIQTNYIRYGNKWIISHEFIRISRNVIKYYTDDIYVFSDVLAVFNVSQSTELDETFVAYINFVAQRLIKYAGDFNDEFWENYAYIPIPEWINSKMVSER